MENDIDQPLTVRTIKQLQDVKSRSGAKVSILREVISIEGKEEQTNIVLRVNGDIERPEGTVRPHEIRIILKGDALIRLESAVTKLAKHLGRLSKSLISAIKELDASVRVSDWLTLGYTWKDKEEYPWYAIFSTDGVSLTVEFSGQDQAMEFVRLTQFVQRG